MLPFSSNSAVKKQMRMIHRVTIGILAMLSIGLTSQAQTGGALNFTNGDYVELASQFNSAIFGTGPFTLETWFKTSMTNGTIMSKRSICNVSNFWNLVITAGKIRFEMMEAGGVNSVDFSTPLTYNDNTWHHVAVTRSNSLVRIFIDGYVVATNTQPGITNLNNTTDPIKLGQSACNNFIGELDETRIWTEAQTVCEIYTNKNYQFNSTSATLKFNAHYNQGSAGGSNTSVTSLTNSASNAFPGTLNTFALSGSSSNWVTSTCPAQGLTSAPFTITQVDACVSYTWGGTTYTNSGTYNHLFTTSAGCDSAVQLQLTIHPLPVLNVTASDNTICSGSDGTMTVNNSTELDYCTPTFPTNSIGNDYISFFNINSMNNASGESPSGYTYYNNVMMTASVGNTNTIQMIIDTTFSQGLAMWIDYNQDGDFDDVNEYYPFNVFSSPILGGTFTVPSSAKNGVTRLRVACRRDAVPAANEYCGGFTYGEFEDYKITISGGVANTNITWSPSTFLISAVGSTVSINNITSATTYTVTLTDAYGCSSTATESIGVNPLPQVTIVSDVSSVCGSDTVELRNNSYCIPSVSAANVSGQHFISAFVFGNNLITNNSGDGPGVYNHYTTQMANVTAGSSYPILIGHGGTLSTSKAIWIDFNHDGDFSDGGEMVYSASTGNTIVSANIAIHPSASNGMTRMRVAVSSAPSISSGQSCSGFFWGEYEDYNLNISGGYNTLSWTPSTFLNTTTGGQVIANNLNATTTYTLTVTDANGCSKTDVQTITKLNVPNVTVNVSNDSICSGSSVTLSGAGASSYVWSNGVTNGVPFAPTTTDTYTVTGTASNGCTDTAIQTVEVLAIPTFPTYSSGVTICPGKNTSIDLLPSYCSPTAPLGYYVGAIITGFQLGSFSSYNPPSGVVYNNYTNQVIEVSADSTYSFHLYHASNSTFYSIFIDYNQNGTFENSELVIDDFTSLPTVSYGVITIPSTALSGKTRIRLAVARNFIGPCQISYDPDFYDSYGQYEDYTLKISGGAQIYSWSPSTYLNTTVSNSVVANSVTSPITYTVTLTGSNGCTATKDISVSLFNNPVVNSNASASMVCIGDSVTLTATGANQYSWSHGVTNGTPFAVNSSTTYTVIGTDTNGCQNTSTQTVNVYSKPTLPSLTSPIECIGLSTQLSLNLNYCTPNVTSNLSNRDYIDTFIFNGNGIQSYTGEGPGNYNYYSNTLANVIAGNTYNFTMGIGGTVANLRAIWVDYNQDGDFTDAGEFVYSAIATLNTVNGSFVIPTTASNGLTRMRVLCTSSIGGSLINTSCSGVVFGEYEDYNLKISGGINSIVWSPSNLLIDSIGSKVQTVALNSNTDYGITVTDIHGCTNQGIYTALVKSPPKINLNTNNNSICPGSNITLSANTTGSVFSSAGPSLVMNGGPSNFYPAVCNVSGLTSGASVKRIYINSLTHSNPDDIDMWLESPNGQMVMLMSDVGGSYSVVNANLIIEDSNAPFPGNNLILSNTPYKPTNDTVDGPNEPLNPSTQLSHFTGNLNGNWNLYVQDDNAPLDSGSMVSFRIEFENNLNNINWTTTNPSAQAGIANPLSLTTNAIVPSNTTYTLTATDANGCSNSSSIDITTDVPTASFSSTAGNTLCVDNANTTLRLGSSTYCVPTHANGPAQSNYYLNSFYLPDGITSPWFIASNQDNYIHYSHIHQLTAGNNYTCTLGYNYANSYVHAWIDYNQDGDFYDAGEYLGYVLGTSSVFGSTVVVPINIPTTARNGYVRLRVAATNSSNNLPCGGNIFGEYEDYDLNISGGVNNPNIVWSPASNLSSANGISVDASNIMSSTTYTVTVSDDGGCTNTSTQTITINPCGNATQTNIKLFIEGYYTGTNTMTTTLSNQGQPSTAGICDTVMIELRDQANTNTLIASSKSLLLTNGNVTVNFAAIPKGYYYIVVKHRNGLETWSATPALITNTSTYDFSSAQNKAYGDNQREVDSGVWAFYSGDVNQDGSIDAFDYVILDPDVINGVSGYLDTDLTGDGFVDAFDYVLLDANLIGGIGSIVP